MSKLFSEAAKSAKKLASVPKAAARFLSETAVPATQLPSKVSLETAASKVSSFANLENTIADIVRSQIALHKVVPQSLQTSEVEQSNLQAIIDGAMKKLEKEVRAVTEKMLKSQQEQESSRNAPQMKVEKEVLIVGYGKMTKAMLPEWCKVSGIKYTIVNPTIYNTPEASDIEYYQTPEGVNGKKFDAIIFGIKPQNFEKVVPFYKDNLAQSAVVISIAAGVTTAKIEELLKSEMDSERKVSVARVMPNLAALVGKSVNAWAKNQHISEEQSEFVEALMGKTGMVLNVSEDKMNAVTAVSGSGPAYVAEFIRSCIQGAKEVGFTSKEARELVMATIDGTTQLLKDIPQNPLLEEEEQLREFIKSVTSKGGTTEAAFKKSFNDGAFADLIVAAIKAAKTRGDELSGAAKQAVVKNGGGEPSGDAEKPKAESATLLKPSDLSR